MTEMKQIADLTSPQQFTVDLEKLRPDPERIQQQHRNSAILFGAIFSAAFGAAGYVVNKTRFKSIYQNAVVAVSSVLGAILGAWYGNQSKTYEEKAYEMLSTAAKQPNSGQALKTSLAKELQNRDIQSVVID